MDREYERANDGHRALGLAGYPSPIGFKNMVRANMIKNCTLTNADINNVNKLFGTDLTMLKGKNGAKGS
jgi:hypothetical protein